MLMMTRSSMFMGILPLLAAAARLNN